MKILIVEDEIVAAKRLQDLVAKCDSDIKIMAVLDSVLDTTNFLSNHTPDLILMDIQLSDGICFEIFEQANLEIPIIFTTAYDEFMQKAFKVNSIDYLLKPIRQEDLNASILKFNRYNHKPNSAVFQQLLTDYIQDKNATKSRFMVKSGRGFISVDISEVAYFVSENRLCFLVKKDGKKFVVDQSLDQLEPLLDPKQFFKISRNFILSCQSIQRIESYFNNRMLVELDPPAKNDVLVGRAFLKNFKRWLDQ